MAKERSRVERDAAGLRVVIRARRDWLLVLVALLLAGWVVAAVGSITRLQALVEGAGPAMAVIFALFWVATTALALSIIGWALLGREVVTVDRDALTLTREAGPYRRARRCERGLIRGLRTDPYRGLIGASLVSPLQAWRVTVEILGLGGGSVLLDHGTRSTHRFGNKLDEPESRRLADLLRVELDLESPRTHSSATQT